MFDAGEIVEGGGIARTVKREELAGHFVVGDRVLGIAVGILEGRGHAGLIARQTGDVVEGDARQLQIDVIRVVGDLGDHKRRKAADVSPGPCRLRQPTLRHYRRCHCRRYRPAFV